MYCSISKKLEGKVAVVTGSTAGIGYAIAQALAENGAKTLISSRKQDNVSSAVKELQKLGLDVDGMVCDVSKEDDRKNLIQKAINDYGKLDILILNAGICPTGPLLETTEKVWDMIFDTNVKSGFLLAKEAMPHLKDTKGSMIFISSVTAYAPFPGIHAYSISKTAIISMVKALASECASSGVRVNGIAPGAIKTDMSKPVLDDPDASQKLLAAIPLNRIGNPSECAGAAVFLSSDDATYITGETLVISGGWLSRL